MGKRVFYDEEARRRILGGARALYEAVKTTMGPKGRNVVIGKGFGGPTVTHDGVTVAKSVEITDVDDETLGYSVGAELIKEAASKMNDVAGDGTTTVTVLTYHILTEAHKLITAGHNPMLLRKGLEQAAEDVLKQLESMSESIEGKKERIAEVATISAGDAEIGALIAEVMSKIGKEGVVTVEEGQSLELESEVVEGFTFNNGYASPYMVTDSNRLEAVYEKPAVVITDKKISNITEISGLMERLVEAGKKDMVLIAEDVDGEALTMLVLNKLKGVFNTVVIKAADMGDQLQDIAVLTGAQVISEQQGHTFENIDLSTIGSARKVIVGQDQTTIIEGGGKQAAVRARVAQLSEQLKSAEGGYTRSKLNERQASLSGKVAVIKVGGASKTEIEEKKYRVDDAVAAVKAALNQGIVAGGGVTLVNLSDSIKIASSDELVDGKQILKTVLLKPFYELMHNSGVNPDEWLPKIREAKPGYGINVQAGGKVVDMKKAGVIDPVAVTRQAIQYSVSIAGTGMTMGALVVDVPEAESSDSGMPAGMGGMGLGM